MFSRRVSDITIGGKEVLPASGLEVAIATSPEVYDEQIVKPVSRKRRCDVVPSIHLENAQISIRKRFRWIGIGVLIFGLGISAGIVVAWTVSRKGQFGSRYVLANVDKTIAHIMQVIARIYSVQF